MLDGQVYGEPLEATGRVYVATENDTDLRAGGRHGCDPVVDPRGDSGAVGATCSPAATSSPTVGITGTPVIDTARGEIFAVADELVDGTPAHFLVGLNMYTGSSVLGQVPSTPRTGLTTRRPISCSAPG